MIIRTIAIGISIMGLGLFALSETGMGSDPVGRWVALGVVVFGIAIAMVGDSMLAMEEIEKEYLDALRRKNDDEGSL